MPQPKSLPRQLDTPFYHALALDLVGSFSKLLGYNFLQNQQQDVNLIDVLYSYPQPIVAHNGAADAIFNFANQAGLELFEMGWGEFIGLPSRYSAELENRQSRQAMLDQVDKFNYIDNYEGIRISATGKRFLIKNSIVWNIFDGNGMKVGQAACIQSWQPM